MNKIKMLMLLQENFAGNSYIYIYEFKSIWNENFFSDHKISLQVEPIWIVNENIFCYIAKA